MSQNKESLFTVAKKNLSYYIKKKKGKTDMQRFRDVLSDPNNKYIDRVKDAGNTVNDEIIMHNGLKVSTNSYYDSFANIFKLNKGVHEPQEERIFMEVLKDIKENGTMIELGSYWSFYSMWFKKEVKNANCYLIESDPAGKKIGEDNFKRNNMEGNFFLNFVGSNGIKIDDFITQQNINFVDILHSDIQGHELEMLKTCAESIKKRIVKYFFISTHGQQLHYDCLNFLKENGYEIVASADFDNETFCYDGVLVARLKEISGILPIDIGSRKKSKMISPLKFFYLYLTRVILSK